MNELDLEKILLTFKNQLGHLSIFYTVNYLNQVLDTKIDNNFNLDEGIKLLLELSKNEDYRKLILFCIISRLETVSNLEFFVLEHECRSTKNPLYEVLKENDVDFRNIIT